MVIGPSWLASTVEPVASVRYKKYKFACAHSEESNMSVHPNSLISVLVFSPEETLDAWLPTECPSKILIRLRGCAG